MKKKFTEYELKYVFTMEGKLIQGGYTEDEVKQKVYKVLNDSVEQMLKKDKMFKILFSDEDIKLNLEIVKEVKNDYSSLYRNNN